MGVSGQIDLGDRGWQCRAGRGERGPGPWHSVDACGVLLTIGYVSVGGLGVRKAKWSTSVEAPLPANVASVPFASPGNGSTVGCNTDSPNNRQGAAPRATQKTVSPYFQEVYYVPSR